MGELLCVRIKRLDTLHFLSVFLSLYRRLCGRLFSSFCSILITFGSWF